MVAALVASYPPGSQGASATGAELCAVAADLLDAIDAHCAGRDEMDRGNPLVPPDEPFFIPTTQEDTVVNEVEVSTHVAEPPAPSAQAREDVGSLRRFATEMRAADAHYYYIPKKLEHIATRIERGYAGGGE